MMLFQGTRAAVLAASAAALLVAVSGCSTPVASADGGSATAGKISWWSWSPDVSVASQYIAEFNKEYPDIEVTFKQVPGADYAAALRPALTSNDGPDVFTVNANGNFSGQALAPFAYDLTSAMEEQLGTEWESKVFSGGPEAWTVDGKLVAAEFAKQSAGVLWINQNLFDQYGLAAPTTLDEWISVCETFRSNGVGCFRQGMATTAGFINDTMHSIAENIEPGAWSEAIAGERKWTDPVFVKTLETLQMLQTDGIMDEGAVGYSQYPDVNNAFLSGETAMASFGTWYAQNARVDILDASLEGAGVASTEDKPVFIPIPYPDLTGQGNPSTIFSDPDTGQSVNVKSASRNAAITFALWLGATASGAQQVANSLEAVSTLKGVDTEWDKVALVNPEVQLSILQEMTLQAEEATENRAVGLGARTNEALINAAQQVTQGASPSSVVDAIQQAADQDQQEQ